MSSYSSDIHLFKKIEEDTLRNGELRIPRSFVTKYWAGISNPVLFLLPDGANWEVNWKKLDADVWLIDNWKKFVEFYSLDQDHLLVFKYVGKSRFQVVIFDQNGLEMRYPLMEGRTDLHYEENGNSLSHRKRAKSLPPISPSTKKVKTNPRKDPNCYPSQDVETKCAQFRRNKVHADGLNHSKPKKRGRRNIMHANKRCSKSMAIQTPLCALERANAFRSENPFFIQEMHPSYIQRSCFLAMPRNFITEDQRSEDDSVTLWNSKDRTWRVKLCANRCNGQNILSTGWKNFVKDNNLKIGDVCVFEQINEPGISFRVFIFPRDREESSPSIFLGYEDGATQSMQRGRQNILAKRGSDGMSIKYSRNNVFNGSEFRRYNKKVSENHFTLCIKPNQLYHKSVPMKFMREHNIDKKKIVTLRIGKRSWPVKLECYSKHNVCRFTSGWSAFMRQCNLKAGNVCFFELIDKKETVFQVRVSRSIH